MKLGRSRPTGITILAILSILSGIVAIILAFFAGALTANFGIGVLGGAITGIGVAVAAFHFVIAFGLLSGKPWGRLIVIAFSLIGLIMGAISLNIFSIIIDGIILYYMWRPHVREYFEGKVSYVKQENNSLNNLKDRLSKGEITTEEYDELKKKLDSE